MNSKIFNFKSVKGISQNQLNQHYKLYEGYINKTNEVWTIINRTPSFKQGNQTYSKLRALLKGQSFALDGVKLHELYFENICNSGERISLKTLNKINESFGSYERFKDMFEKSALSVRGWTILSLEPKDGKLHIYGLDAHDDGPIVCSIPILVLDVYEHAYMIDFGIDRKKYIDIFMKTINWKVIDKRITFGENLLKQMPN